MTLIEMLTELTNPDGSEELPLNKSGLDRKISLSKLPVSELTQTALNAKLDSSKVKISYATSDETRSNSPIFADAGNMSAISLGVGDMYWFRLVIMFTSVNNAGRIKYRLSGPSGSTSSSSNSAWSAGTANPSNNIIGSSGWTASSGDATTRIMAVEGYITNPSNAGNLTVQWAQQASDAGNTVLKMGTLLLLVKLN